MEGTVSLPFHIHSPIPPLVRTGSQRSLGAACNKLIASIRFDFPDPFGPINTFRDFNSSSGVSGPNDSRFRNWIDLRNRFSPIMQSSFYTPGALI
jgi:hypothetical protein